MGIYVEVLIRGPIEELWLRTQTPELHQRWDLRFTEIEYLPRSSDAEPQQFLYSTCIGFGMKIDGRGESLGTIEQVGGRRTSSLKFWSADPKSLISEGSGYWQYIPTETGIKFLTWYDYQTRFGMAGKMLDTIFRPLISWATAWSFDSLRLWIEQGILPEQSFRNSAVYAISRITIAFVWLYHGLVPKIIFQSSDEIKFIEAAGCPPEFSVLATLVFGCIEIAIAVLMLIFWKSRHWFVITATIMVFAMLGVALTSPSAFELPFTPATLNTCVIALCAIGLVAERNLPSAGNCLRTKPEDVN
jgi:hypothetical protein